LDRDRDERERERGRRGETGVPIVKCEKLLEDKDVSFLKLSSRSRGCMEIDSIFRRGGRLSSRVSNISSSSNRGMEKGLTR
jgi:hypothetical protein